MLTEWPLWPTQGAALESLIAALGTISTGIASILLDETAICLGGMYIWGLRKLFQRELQH